MKDFVFRAQCKPFKSLPRGRYRLWLDTTDPQRLRVWHPGAGCYTTQHTLSDRTQQQLVAENVDFSK